MRFPGIDKGGRGLVLGMAGFFLAAMLAQIIGCG